MGITIKKGLDLPLAGKPGEVLDGGRTVTSVALMGRDYAGLKPRMLVKAGDAVVLGQPLFVDKRDPAVPFVSPGTGTVSAVHRGHRRRLLSVVIDLEDPSTTVSLQDPAPGDIEDQSREAIVERLCASGLWTSLRTRPFGKVPAAGSQPRSIFVTAIDSNPLAANPVHAMSGRHEALEAGLRVLGQLTDGCVHLCTAADWDGTSGDGKKIRHTVFDGPHPAGLVGTHIHHLDPVSADRTVWHILYQDVAAIGRLFTDGVLDVSRTVALGGAGVANPRILMTRIGASIQELTAGELQHDGGQPRLISGPVLSGREAREAEAFLGRYHQQVAAIPEERGQSWFGWLGIRRRGHSFAGLFRRRRPRVDPSMSTATGGLPRTLIPVDVFERVLPLDLLPVPLLRALMIQDTDKAQALGCLELDAEDLALCSYVCPGKVDYGRMLRVNLEKIEREG